MSYILLSTCCRPYKNIQRQWWCSIGSSNNKTQNDNINCILQDVLYMQMLDNTNILNFLNTLFGILPQNDGHFNELDLH